MKASLHFKTPRYAPSVATYFFSNSPVRCLLTKVVLPTPPSPTRMSLNSGISMVAESVDARRLSAFCTYEVVLGVRGGAARGAVSRGARAASARPRRSRRVLGLSFLSSLSPPRALRRLRRRIPWLRRWDLPVLLACSSRLAERCAVLFFDSRQNCLLTLVTH